MSLPAADAARMAVRALTEVFEIPHPGYLMCDSEAPPCSSACWTPRCA